MVIYNPKDWWKLIFNFNRSDTFRIMLPGILGVALFTGLVAYLENDVLKVSFKNTTAIHSLVGFVLSLLLVFRTNTAYDRWWEGRKAWGSFVNNSRSLALKISVLSVPEEEKRKFGSWIAIYLQCAKEHLREGVSPAEWDTYKQMLDPKYHHISHRPNAVMQQMWSQLYDWLRRGVIVPQELLLLNDDLKSFTDNIGVCERIKRTPIPYSYSTYLKKIIFLYVFTMPIGFVREFGYWAMPIVAIIFYIFGSIELLAEEIEDPFGRDTNDLPTDSISMTIAANVEELLGGKY